jgi:purine-cytosine permease-like protein
VNPERPRTPNFTRFLVIGAILGFVVGAAVAVVGPQAGNYSTNTAVGYLGVLGAVLGVALAGIVALVVDWLRHRSGPQA